MKIFKFFIAWSFLCLSLSAQQADFLSFKSQFPKKDVPSLHLKMDSVYERFYENFDQFSKQSINEAKQISGLGFSYFKKCHEQYIKNRSHFLDWNVSLEKAEAIAYYSYPELDVFVVQVGCRFEIEQVQKIGILTDKQGNLLKVTF